MLSTNSRAFKDKVKLWILANADFTDDDLSPNMDSFHDVAISLMTIFIREKNGTSFPSFEDWCRGLPDCLFTWSFLFGMRGKALLEEWKEVDDLDMDEMQAESAIIHEIYKVIHAEYEKEMNKK